ncbi:MAG: hypothetical protein COA79_10135 [Planctomycetota bacterium]|nr:MAG: hypothetical protein COA79_10135 [Planctomycetota bacterium]
MKLKFFWLLLFLTFGAGIYMVVLGFDLKKEKHKLNGAKTAKRNIEKWSKEISRNRAKINSQRKLGNRKIDINQGNIANICSKNGAQMQSFNAIPPIDRDEYLEAGYTIKIKSVSKKNLAVIFWDIENKILGSKIKSVRMSRSAKIKKFWNVSFIVIKSIPKFDQEEANENK